VTVEMELLGVRLEIPANAPVVLLREQGGDRRVLPIYIGPEEAKAIAMALEGVVPPRPLTHDLLRDVVTALGAELRRVTVTELRERTFFAELDLVVGDRSIVVSARPSDAIALAVRVEAPLYANEEVLADAGAPSAEGEEEEQEEIVDQFREFIDQVNPEDFAS
jgi:bifunctional DNase/RNase